MSWEKKEVVTTFLTLNGQGTSPGQRGVSEGMNGKIDEGINRWMMERREGGRQRGKR